MSRSMTHCGRVLLDEWGSPCSRVRRRVASGRHGLVADNWRSAPPLGHAAPPMRVRLNDKLGVTELLQLAPAP